jgi:monoamine oxidase
MSDRTDVLIIGAGAAGLAAAARLKLAGVSGTLVEARDRIGGRIHTIHPQGSPLPIELGAEFVHGRPPQTWDLIRAANLAANEVTEHHWHVHKGQLHDAADFFEQVDRILGKLSVDGPEQSFTQFLRTCCPEAPNEIREMALMFVEGFNAARADLISTTALAADQEAAEQIDETRNFRLIGGYSQILDLLAKQSAADIRLNTILRELRWRREHVEAICDSPASLPSAPTFQARRAILTLPLSLLQLSPDAGVRFDPDLPDKRDAARKLQMGPVVKIILQFREAFWERKDLPAAKGKELPSLSFIHSRAEEVPTWWTQSPVASTILTGWAGGPKADRLSLHPPSTVIESALDSLSHMLGLTRAEIDPLLQTWHIADWQADPFSRGAYSYVPVGEGDARKQLAAPVESTLFFAGEATHQGQSGTVAGALASGYRAADEVLHSLRGRTH